MVTKQQAARQVARTYITDQAQRLASERRARIRNTIIVSAAVLFLFAAVLDSVGVF
jgi:phosphoserine phosphatase